MYITDFLEKIEPCCNVVYNNSDAYEFKFVDYTPIGGFDVFISDGTLTTTVCHDHDFSELYSNILSDICSFGNYSLERNNVEALTKKN